MTEKRVILTIGNVRIKKYDNLNVVIERYEEVVIPSTKDTVNKWRFKGFARSVLSALLFIQKNELLVNKNNVTDLNSYVEQVEKSNASLLEVVKE